MCVSALLSDLSADAMQRKTREVVAMAMMIMIIIIMRVLLLYFLFFLNLFVVHVVCSLFFSIESRRESNTVKSSDSVLVLVLKLLDRRE